MQYYFDVVVERDEEGYYVASVPQLPGCHTQARSLDEVTTDEVPTELLDGLAERGQCEIGYVAGQAATSTRWLKSIFDRAGREPCRQ